MKFKLSAGWLRGQFFHPAGEELDLGDNDDPEFWREHGLLPPPDSCAMDLQAAVVMHKVYPHIAHRLYRKLSAEDGGSNHYRCAVMLGSGSTAHKNGKPMLRNGESLGDGCEEV